MAGVACGRSQVDYQINDQPSVRLAWTRHGWKTASYKDDAAGFCSRCRKATIEDQASAMGRVEPRRTFQLAGLTRSEKKLPWHAMGAASQQDNIGEALNRIVDIW